MSDVVRVGTLNLYGAITQIVVLKVKWQAWARQSVIIAFSVGFSFSLSKKLM